MMIIQTLYYALPGLVANMMPVLVRKRFGFFAVPVDHGRMLFGKKIFGTHKTYRGFIFGLLGAIIVAFIQTLLYKNGILVKISYIDYSWTSFILIGAALGFGALFGDLARSFFKRRAGIKEGDRWFPLDQIDYTLGISLFSLLVKPLTLLMFTVLVISGAILSILATRSAYLLKIRDEKW